MHYQTTISETISLSGPGLHTGKYTHVSLKPASADTGILFFRSDLGSSALVPALVDNVRDTNHGTTIAKGEAAISTIEHLMSALHGMQVDNVVVDVDGPEIPILDGSARLWVEQIAKVGLTQLDAERRYITLQHPVEWSDSDSGIMMVAEPSDCFSVECNIEFKSELIGSQQACINGFDGYADGIARCRTFVFLHEIEPLLSLNLIKGGDLDNALVFVDKPIDDAEKERLAAIFGKDKESITVHNGVLNTVEPFFDNEPARHKLLDFIGDIYLLGSPLKAAVSIKCPGHRANTEFAKKIYHETIRSASRS